MKQTILIKNGRVLPVAGPAIENGAVLVKDGKIVEVGAIVNVPADATIIDAKGGWVTPGLIDAHCHLFMMGEPSTVNAIDQDGNETTDPVTPHMKGCYAVNPLGYGIKEVREAGITAACILPGSANIIGGTGASIKLAGRSREEMVIPGTEQMKMALGENPKRIHFAYSQRAPLTRMANAALMRNTLTAALKYAEKSERAGDDPDKQPPYDPKMEALVPVVTGKMRVRIHCHRAYDIQTAIEVSREFKLDYILEHVTEGHKIVDYLADNKVPGCIVGPLLIGPIKPEIWDFNLNMASMLMSRGIPVCLSADESSKTRWLPYEAGILVQYGMSFDDILRALTINPARVMQVEDRIGTLEKGKDADIAIFDGNPFHNYTSCVMTMINGEVIHNQGL